METDRYLEFVCSSAEEKGKRFILDSGEGRDVYFDGMYCEDLSAG